MLMTTMMMMMSAMMTIIINRDILKSGVESISQGIGTTTQTATKTGWGGTKSARYNMATWFMSRPLYHPPREGRKRNGAWEGSAPFPQDYSAFGSMLVHKYEYPDLNSLVWGFQLQIPLTLLLSSVELVSKLVEELNVLRGSPLSSDFGMGLATLK